jgi:uncharacterized protein YjbJ (UPF0337 family)
MDSDRVKGAAKEALGKVEGAFGQATGNAETEASGTVREAEGIAQNTIGQAKDAVREAAGSAVNATRSIYEGGAEAVATNVQERPGSALLVAGIIGFTLGVIFTKGSRPAPRRPWDRYYRA